MNKRPLVLVACEYSQVVTTALRAAGAVAFSCDLEPCTGGHPEWHIQCDVEPLLSEKWDLVIAHPPCTYLCRSSAVALSKDETRREKMKEARNFFMKFTQLGCPTCIENPVPLRAAGLPQYSQIICPSQFGHKYTKKTCLWLYELPPLLPMRAQVIGADQWVKHCAGNGKRRAYFWEYIAQAMAVQWLPLV